MPMSSYELLSFSVILSSSFSYVFLQYSHLFRLMCLSSDESLRCSRKPFMTNNEHDYSQLWNINSDDYGDMDLSEYLIDTKDESSLLPEPEIPQTPAIDETQNFDAPAPVKPARRYSCPVCSKLWVTPSKLKRHMSVHRSARHAKEADYENPSLSTALDSETLDPEVQCPICCVIELQSKLPQHMNIHVKTENNPQMKKNHSTGLIEHAVGKSLYQCSICNQKFGGSLKLQKHMKTRHNRLKLKSFQSSSRLKRRLSVQKKAKTSRRRQTLLRHACLHCGKRFVTPSKLLRHQSVHRDILPIMKNESLADNSPILEISAVTSILGD